MKNIISESNCIRIDGTLIALNTINIIKIKDGVRISDVDGDFYFDLLIQDILIDGDAPQSANLLLEYFKDNAFSAGGVTPPDPTATLTISITGLPDEYEVSINGVVWPNNMKTFPLGTILTNIVPTADGYTFTPSSQGPITMDEDKTLSFVAQASQDYVIEKKWSLNLAREFANDATEVGITWNNFKATDAGIVVALGSSLNNLVAEDNTATTLSVTNKLPFDGASNGLSNYVSENPVYPIVAVNSGFQLSDPTALRFSGANPDKYYQLYILTSVSTSDSAITVSNGAQSVSHNSSNNYPVDGDNRYSSQSMMRLNDIVPDENGVFEIDFQRNGNYYISPINLILIQQSNTFKP